MSHSNVLTEFGSLTSPPTTPGAQVSGSLTREEDLKPTASDLDNLFEPDSDDDAVSYLTDFVGLLTLVFSKLAHRKLERNDSWKLNHGVLSPRCTINYTILPLFKFNGCQLLRKKYFVLLNCASKHVLPKYELLVNVISVHAAKLAKKCWRSQVY